MLSGQRENLAAQPAHIGNMATPNVVISGMQLREASQAEPARDCGDTKYYHEICPIFVYISLESFKKYRSGVVLEIAETQNRKCGLRELDPQQIVRPALEMCGGLGGCILLT